MMHPATSRWKQIGVERSGLHRNCIQAQFPALWRRLLTPPRSVPDDGLMTARAAATRISPLGAVHAHAAHRHILSRTHPGPRIDAPDERGRSVESLGSASRIAAKCGCEDDRNAQGDASRSPPKRDAMLSWHHERNVAAGSVLHRPDGAAQNVERYLLMRPLASAGQNSTLHSSPAKSVDPAAHLEAHYGLILRGRTVFLV
jgi:hypothetical protein